MDQDQMGLVVGIDLGTTNSVIAIIEDGRPRVIENLDSTKLTPSVVAVAPSGEMTVGALAKRQAVAIATDTIYSIKRFMGRYYDDEDVQRDAHMVPYQTRRASNGEVEVKLGDRWYSPPEVSAFILKAIISEAETQLGRITHAVITVPAYFGVRQKNATRRAGQLAGVKVMHILPEPNAAALAYGIGLKGMETKYLLVYDLGGGTFDATVLMATGGVFEPMGSTGNNHLGGDDFDHKIMDYIISTLPASAQKVVRATPQAMQQLKDRAEEAKVALSRLTVVTINIPSLCMDGTRNVNINLQLTRRAFEEMIAPDIEHSIAIAKDAVRKANVPQIDHVLLVGGSSQIPLVIRRLEEEFGKEKISRKLNPMECVALGAAVQTALPIHILCPDDACREINRWSDTRCKKCGKDLFAEDEVRPAQKCPNCGQLIPLGASVCTNPTCNRPAPSLPIGQGGSTCTTKPLGIQAVGDKMDVIIKPGIAFPMMQPKTVRRFTSSSGRNLLRIPVYEGFDEVASKNEYLGEIREDLPSGLPDQAPVIVGFRLDPDGILTVTAELPSELNRVFPKNGQRKIVATFSWGREGEPPAPPPAPSPGPGAPVDLSWEEKAEMTEMRIMLTLEQREFIPPALQADLFRVRLELAAARGTHDRFRTEQKIAEAEKLLEQTGFVQPLMIGEVLLASHQVPGRYEPELRRAVENVKGSVRARNVQRAKQAIEELIDVLGRIITEMGGSGAAAGGGIDLSGLLQISSTGPS